jgi:hypothetical protein
MRLSAWKVPAIVVACLPLLGMGALGGGGGSTPERNYEGTFVDRDGTRVEAKWITASGDLALTGELGRGTLRVPFDNIKTLEFGAGEARDALTAKVTLHKGSEVELRVRSSLSFSGQTPLGTYQVRARDLKSVEFQPE